jgi:hypothetical protein
MLLGKTQRYDDAQRELEACLRADPAFADAHELLGDLLMARHQAPAAAPVGRTRSGFGESSRAAFSLGMALACRSATAKAQSRTLRKAAAAPDAEIRERALGCSESVGTSPGDQPRDRVSVQMPLIRTLSTSMSVRR